ncbi:MAG TPA: S41 family peptidase [Fimbriimonadaceae bacterium]|nr:S41 family peptidase [Fimbriimonadaceae bacterium]
MRKFFRPFWAVALALVALPGLAQETSGNPFAAKPADFNAEIRTAVLTRMGEVLQRNAFVPGADFGKWNEFLAKHNEAINKAETADQFSIAVNGALREFGFSHIVLSTPKAATARMERKVVGIGVQLQPEETGGLRVMTTFPGAPADKAGIVPGDLILEANGKKATSPSEISGDEGSVVKLKVLREDGKTKDFTITRAKFSTVRPETLTWVNKATAVIRIPTFDLGYDRKRVETLFTEAKDAKNLVLDLRSNGGGAVINLTHLMGLLMPENSPLGTFVGRAVVDSYVKETGGKPTDIIEIASWTKSKLRSQKNSVPPYKGNLAVLINGGSGSAAEIAAAALQDVMNVPVLGSKSAGAVLVSVMGPLPNGWQLQYPITDFVTMSGYRLEGKGVTPLVDAAMPRKPNDPDPGIEKAVALLNRIALREERSSGGKN